VTHLAPPLSILGSIIGMVPPLDSHRFFTHFGNVFEPYHALALPCLHSWFISLVLPQLWLWA
jgi:hypothetical protein